MIALLLVGCSMDAPIVTTATPAPVAPRPSVAADPIGLATPPDAAIPARSKRRMRIDQLDASIRAATGFTWNLNGTNQFEALAGSLGVPDYVERVTIDRDAGLLFQKFLDDAANSVCDDLVEAEFQGRSSVFLTHVELDDTVATNPEGVDDTLRAAVLRFHGYRIPEGDPQLDTWRFLFEGALSVTGNDTRAAWRTVCIGLIVHPDFYQY